MHIAHDDLIEQSESSLWYSFLVEALTPTILGKVGHHIWSTSVRNWFIELERM